MGRSTDCKDLWAISAAVLSVFDPVSQPEFRSVLKFTLWSHYEQNSIAHVVPSDGRIMECATSAKS